MYRRLSLALLLLSASLCGMERNEGKSLRRPSFFAALKAKFFGGATPLPDSSEATAEEPKEELSSDRPDVMIEQPGAESSKTGPSHMCMGSDTLFFSRENSPRRDLFPGEQGEGYLY